MKLNELEIKKLKSLTAAREARSEHCILTHSALNVMQCKTVFIYKM